MLSVVLPYKLSSLYLDNSCLGKWSIKGFPIGVIYDTKPNSLNFSGQNPIAMVDIMRGVWVGSKGSAKLTICVAT